jgi:hypothetical protein
MEVTSTIRPRSFRALMLSAGLTLLAGLLASAAAAEQPPAGPPRPDNPSGSQGPAARQTQNPGNADAQAVIGFLDRVNAYVAIHQKLEAKAPKLPDQATPKQIDDRQRGFAKLIQASRPEAKAGDIFTPEMGAFAKRMLTRVFAGPDGKQLLSSIMDENPVTISLKANQRYPDSVPFTTMPPEVLEELPELPEELQFRFIGRHLILLDPHAQLIVDFVADALPGR